MHESHAHDKFMRGNSLKHLRHTIKIIAVWLSWLFGIFEVEARIRVCEISKIPKSAKLHTQI